MFVKQNREHVAFEYKLSVGDMIAQEVIAESGAVAEEARQALEELDKLEQQEEAATEAIEKEQEEQGAASPNEE
jgi:predicted RNA-binding protein with PIN domain